MNKINFTLQMRLKAVQNRAAEWSKHNPEGAYKSALDHQVKYGRKGWIKYDSANDYSDKGKLRLYNLDSFDAIPIQDISRRAFDYSGYYADNFQQELIKPYIVQIKTGRGLFIAPAIAYSDCDIATIYLSRGQFCPKLRDDYIYDSIAHDCARIADSIADQEAEKSRESDAQYQAESQADDLKEANQEARKAAQGLIVAIRDQRAIGDIVAPICTALISEIKGLRAEIWRNNERINALKNDYWLSVQ